MSKSQIEVELKTKYSGEGFKKADTAIKQFSKQAKTATDSVQKVTNALGTLDGKAGKIAGSIGSIFNSFAHGGVIGLAISGITTAFSFLSDKINEAREKSKQAAEEITTQFKSILTMMTKMADVRNQLTGTDIDKSNQTLTEDTQAALQYNAKKTSLTANAIQQEGVSRRAGMTDAEEIAEDVLQEKVKLLENAASGIKEQFQIQDDFLQLKRQNLEEKRDAKIEAQTETRKNYLVSRNEVATKMNTAINANDVDVANAYAKNLEELELAFNKEMESLDDEISKLAENIKGVDVQIQANRDQRDVQRSTNQTAQVQAKAAIDHASIEREKKNQLEAQKAFEENEKIRSKLASESYEIQEKYNELEKKELREKEAKLRSDAVRANAEREQVELEAKITALDQEIVKRKEQQATMTSFFQNGGTLTDWMKPYHGDKDAEESAKNVERQKDNAKRRLDNLKKLVFDKNGNVRKGANTSNVKMYNELKKVYDDMTYDSNDDENTLQQYRNDMKQSVQNMASDLESIKQALTNGGVAI